MPRTSGMIIGATAVITGLAILVKVAGIAKELVVAAYFGTSDALDALVVASLLPSFVTNVFAVPFGSAFIPTFVESLNDEGIAQRLLSTFTSVAVVVVLAVSAGMFVFAGPALSVLGSGFDADKLALARHLFNLLLPMVLASALAAIGNSVLNATRRFVVPALAPIAVPICTLVGVLAPPDPSSRISGMAWGMTLGFFLVALAVLARTRRAGFSPVPAWPRRDQRARRIGGQYVPLVIGSLITASNDLVDRGMAAMLGRGSVAALEYGTKLVNVGISIGTNALGVVLLPHFSAMAARGEMDDLRRLASRWCGYVLAGVGVAAISLFYLSPWITRTLFERGQFTTSDSVLVAQVQGIFGLQMPFFFCGIVLARLISALRMNVLLLVSSFVTTIVNAVLNLLLIRRLGVVGIAAASVGMAVFGAALLGLLARRALRGCAPSEKSGI